MSIYINHIKRVQFKTLKRTYHDQMMNSIVIRVTKIHPDGSDSEAKALRSPPNDSWGFEGVNQG